MHTRPHDITALLHSTQCSVSTQSPFACHNLTTPLTLEGSDIPPHKTLIKNTM